ncbi:hypothetical protein GCM10010389_07880 [Streptomyces echinoruber]|uniref:Uncharacterized protein n=2 Tax=Streptomyces echinoruber TaxID=68898 RepID=A0A918V6F9_9ACTN|nr:hypothetical protein GCM10010389_07880 [Streptomyces echinoruber]
MELAALVLLIVNAASGLMGHSAQLGPLRRDVVRALQRARRGRRPRPERAPWWARGRAGR